MLLSVKKKIDEITDHKAALISARAKCAEIEKRAEAIAAETDEADDEKLKNLEEQLAEVEKEKAEAEEEIKKLEEAIAETEKDLEDLREEAKKPVTRKEFNRMTTRKIFNRISDERREAIMQDQETRTFIDAFKKSIEQRSITGGNLLLPVSMLSLIKENIFEYSKLIKRVRMVEITGQGRMPIAGTIPEGIWTEACAAVNDLALVFNQVTIDGYKISGYIPLCNAIKDGTDYDIAAEIVEILGAAIGKGVDKAIIYGTGTNMPQGIVPRLAQTTKPSSYPANAPAWADLHTSNIVSIAAAKTGAEFYTELIKAAAKTANTYASGEMFWAMNSNTYWQLKAKAVAFDVNGAIVANVGGTMPGVGGNIEICEFIPDGDIVGGYGDLYLLGQRKNISISMSEHAQFIQDNTVYKATALYDGVPVVAGAFVAINIAGATPATSATFATA